MVDINPTIKRGSTWKAALAGVLTAVFLVPLGARAVNALLNRITSDEYFSLVWYGLIISWALIILTGLLYLIYLYAFSYVVWIAAQSKFNTAMRMITLILLVVGCASATIVAPQIGATVDFAERLTSQRDIMNRSRSLHDSVDMSSENAWLQTEPWSGTLRIGSDQRIQVQWDLQHNYEKPMACANFIVPERSEDTHVDFGFAFRASEGGLLARAVMTTNGEFTFRIEDSEGTWSTTPYTLSYRELEAVANLRAGREIHLCAIVDTNHVYTFIDGALVKVFEHPFDGGTVRVAVFLGHYSDRLIEGTSIHITDFVIYLTEESNRFPIPTLTPYVEATPVSD